jgi:glycerol-3-phosphate acyltransferase PlsY
MMFEKFLFLLATYLVCSVPFGLVLTKIFTKQDLRELGSKNIGATNVSRVAGKKLGLITLILDGLKGAIMVIIARFAFANSSHSDMFLTLVALVAVLGHCYSLYLKFNGGKGVATAIAVTLAINPLVGIFTILIWLLAFLIYRISSISSLCSTLLAIAFGLYAKAPIEQILLFIALFALITIRHKENIDRLIKGEEKKVEL